MPVFELVERMPMSEFMGWIAYHSDKLDQMERMRNSKGPRGPNLLDMDPADIAKVFK